MDSRVIPFRAFGALDMFTKAIVRPPAPNFSEGLTTAGLGAPNYKRALAQHEAYCAALERCGLTLTRLEADEQYPDSCFVEDAAILVVADGDQPLGERQHEVESRIHPLTQVVPTKPLAILTRPGAPSRAGEVEPMRAVLGDLFPALLSIQSPGTLDGGDVCEAGRHFFIGISERTNDAGARQLAEMLASGGYTISFVDIRGLNTTLHLKSGLAYLGDDRLVVTDELAGRAEFCGYDLIRIDSGEEHAANCIRVNEHVLVAAGYPAFENRLREMGYRMIALDMSEFQKMDGGLSCLSLRF